jgi:hypothetical protein
MADEATVTQGNTLEESAETVQSQAQTDTQVSGAAEQPQEQPTEEQAGQQEEVKADDNKEGLLGKKAEETVPESYEWTLPEGSEELTDEDKEQLNALAKEAGLTADAAPSAMKFAQSIVAEATKAQQDKLLADDAAWQADQQKQWESNPDHELLTIKGSEAIDHLSSKVESLKGLRGYLEDQGYVKDAVLARVFAEYGKIVSEAKVITGGSDTEAKSNRFYDASPELCRY